MAPCLLTIPPGVSGQALPSQGHVRSKVLVTARMAAQRWDPENLSPKQHRCRKCQGRVFLTPPACGVACGICWRSSGRRAREGHSSSMKSGLEAPPDRGALRGAEDFCLSCHRFSRLRSWRGGVPRGWPLRSLLQPQFYIAPARCLPGTHHSPERPAFWPW